LIILVLEVEISDPNENDIQQGASDAAIYAIVVVRSILRPNSVSVAVPESEVQQDDVAYLKIRLPQMPPMPPKPTRVALQKALFHWPRILFA